MVSGLLYQPKKNIEFVFECEEMGVWFVVNAFLIYSIESIMSCKCRDGSYTRNRSNNSYSVSLAIPH